MVDIKERETGVLKSMVNIVSPRREYEDYKVGGRTTEMFPGKVYKADILAIGSTGMFLFVSIHAMSPRCPWFESITLSMVSIHGLSPW